MTDRYPPFSLEPDERYPVDIEVSNDRLNRWAVFFRLVLVIPAVVVVTLLSLGLGVLSVVNWFVTLIMGRQPRSFFEAYGALLRYATRLNAYYYLLTSFYPFGLAGDREAASDGESPPPPALDTPPVGPPESDADAVAESEGDTAVADLAKVGPDGVTPAPSGSDAPVLPPPPPMLDASPPWTAPSWDVVRRPPGWSFVMGTGGRIVLVVAIVLGLGYGAFLGFAISRIHLNQSLFAQSDASSAYQGLVSEISAFGTAQDQCLKDDATESTQQVACVEGNYRTLADQVANYQSTLSEIEFPSSASSQAVAAQSAASALTQALRRVAAGGSTYQDLSNAVAQANLSEASQQVALTYTQLNQALQ